MTKKFFNTNVGRWMYIGNDISVLFKTNYETFHMQYTEGYFPAAQIENYIGNILKFLIFMLKTLLVGTR